MVAIYTQQWFSWALRCFSTETEWNLSCALALATCSRAFGACWGDCLRSSRGQYARVGSGGGACYR